MKNKPKIEPINRGGFNSDGTIHNSVVREMIGKLNECIYYINALLDEKDNILKKEK